MKKYQQIIREIIPKDCIWDEGYPNEFNISNCPVKYIELLITEVVSQNNRELKDVLFALLHIYKDATFGDNVWRLMIEEKAEKLINQKKNIT